LPINRLSLAFFGVFLSLVGCGKPSPPVTFYNLAPINAAPAAVAASSSPVLMVGIGPVLLPESLGRAQIAARIDEQSIKFDEFHRWSGSLEEDFFKVLLEDLAANLPASTQVAAFPWGAYFQPTHWVKIDVRQFDGMLGGDVILEARWVVTSGDGKKLLAGRKSLIRTSVKGPDFEHLVAAQSEAVAALAGEIADAIKH